MTMETYGIDIGFIAFFGLMFLILGLIFFATESWNKGKRIKRQKEKYNLLQSKVIIIIATYLRTGNVTSGFHLDKLTEIVGTAKSHNENLQEAKVVTDQFEIRGKLIPQLEKIADELRAKNDSVFFDNLSRSGEEFFGRLENYGIRNPEDVRQLYDWVSQAYCLEKTEN